MRTVVLENANEAVRALKAGELVALPTETVYGLAGLGLEPEVLAKIFAAKDRPTFDPLILHIARPGQISQLASEVPHDARRLVDNFWPGPLTLVLPKKPHVPDLATAGLGTVAVRCPRHPLMRQVIEKVGSPLAAPSANLFGRLSPTSAEHVVEQLEGRIPYVLDGGPCEVGVESTIVGFLPDGVYLLRPGGLPTELIERMIGPLKRPTSSGTASEGGQSAPGQLPQHYAPVTPIVVIDGWHQLLPGDGVLTLKDVPEGHGGAVIQLSAKGNLKEAASRFFEALHELDRAGVLRIAAVRFPEQGLGLALNDRLLRAAATHKK